MSDSFSFGVVMYEIATQSDPWDSVPIVQVAQKVCAGERMQIPSHVPFYFQSIILA